MNQVDVGLFDALPLAGATLVVVLAIWGGWRLYQRCPHCGRLVRRVTVGWRRCGHCGRQYRKGLKLR